MLPFLVSHVFSQIDIYSKAMSLTKTVNYNLITGILLKSKEIEELISSLTEDVDENDKFFISIKNKQIEFEHKLRLFLDFQFIIRKDWADKTEYTEIGKEIRKFLKQDLKSALEDEDYLKAAEITKSLKSL